MLHTQILKQYFGYDSFRMGQEHLIDCILTGRDCLGIMPTGAGKSICFQLPALMMDGITLIISPLISLMKDQVNSLTQAGVAAAYINSSLTERQISIVLDRARNGAYKLIYIAPERLLSFDISELARRIKISMLTVDEAHCISQWGQDFRPSYAKIPEFIEQLPHRPIVSAFTATATPRVRDDILSLLRLQNPTVLVTGFNRENLYFEVQKPKDKFFALTVFLRDKKDKNGIVYCSTRNAVEEVCQKLNDCGYSASRYHAGLADKERHQNQEDFLYDRVKIMVATNAFGLGIDKSNVSFVVHYNMPKDVESYYQEAGRAGRDGEPAECLLLYSGQDVRTNTWLIENGRDMEYPDKETEEMLKERDRKRLREMTFYCAANSCLREYILKYFGEKPPNFCGNCGSCNTNFETTDITIESQKILSCVYRMQERYGITMIVDVLRGSKSEKVLRPGLDKLSTYGISMMSENQLRDIINYLILNGYLVKTDTEYPVIRLGEHANAVLRGGETVTMKLSNSVEQPSVLPRNRSETKSPAVVQPVDKVLLATLRDLRLVIATEQKVPAYVIFPDSTLTDMSMKIPTDDNEMLAVSGVGQVKLEKYGKRFLKAINEYIASGGTSNRNVETAGKQEIESPPTIDSIEISDDPVTISIIADRINSVIMQSGHKKINGQKINDWLISKGYMEKITENEKNHKIPTEQGTMLGITSEERLIKGEPSKMNLYAKPVQELIVEQVLEIINFATGKTKR